MLRRLFARYAIHVHLPLKQVAGIPDRFDVYYAFTKEGVYNIMSRVSNEDMGVFIHLRNRY